MICSLWKEVGFEPTVQQVEVHDGPLQEKPTPVTSVLVRLAVHRQCMNCQLTNKEVKSPKTKESSL